MAHVDDCIGQLAAVDPKVVEEALRGLAGEGGSALDPILTRLEAEGDSHTRINLLRAMGRVAHENDLYYESVIRRLDVWAIRRDLADDESRDGRYERATWIKVLGMAGDPGVLPRLLPAMADADPRVRSNAVEGVAFVIKRWNVTGGHVVQEVLERAQRDPVPRVATTATVALYLLHSVAARGLKERLRELSFSGDAETAAAAKTATAIFGIGIRRVSDFFGDSIYGLLRRPDDMG